MLQNKTLDVNKKDSDGINSFWISCYFGHGRVMSVLAEAGCDVFNTDPKGNNVLHVAARRGGMKGYPSAGIISMLIKSKFPLDEQNNRRETAVSIAAQRGNIGGLAVLINAGAKLDVLNKHDISALYLAILNDQDEAVELLVKSGALVFCNQTNKQKDNSPIFLAIRKQRKKYIA